MKDFSLSKFKKFKFTTALFVFLCFILISLLVYAGSEVKFALDPLTPTRLELKPAEKATVQYQVTNNTKLLRTLTMVPIDGIIQGTGAGFCSSPFTLAPKTSCLLNLNVVASQMTSHVIGGPQICKTMGPNDNRPSPFLCSQPSYINVLNINVIPTARNLVSIQITPQDATIPAGGDLQFTAIGTYADGSVEDITQSVTWSTASNAIASISNAPGTKGFARGISHTGGSTIISATLNNVSASTTLTVTAATLDSITVSPTNVTIHQYTNVQYTAIGSYSDGKIEDITSRVSWSSSDAAIVIISNNPGTNGLSSGVGVGDASITAILDGRTDTTNITIVPDPIVSISIFPTVARIAALTTQAFKATGLFADNRTQDLTITANWSSANTSVATVSNTSPTQGVATGVVPGGSTSIIASYQTESNNALIYVSNATLTAIRISPTSTTIAQGTTQQFIARGVFSDGTEQDITTLVQWISSDPPTASISSNYTTAGLATGNAAGDGTTVHALFNGINSPDADITVTDAILTQLNIDPSSASIAASNTKQFKATATFSDGSTQDVTTQTLWSSSDELVATISNSTPTIGLASATPFGGNTTISADFNGLSNTANLQVTIATLVSITVTPAGQTVDAGEYIGFTATGRYNDGTDQDITNIVNWTSTDQDVATISNADGSKGVALALGQGGTTTTTIRATYNGISGETLLTVNPSLIGIEILPNPAGVPLGATTQLSARGYYTDGTFQDLTNVSTWTTQSGTGSITFAGPPGSIRGATEGQAKVFATYNGLIGNGVVNINPAALVSINITPDPATVPLGDVKQLTATGTYTDGSTNNLTTLVTWTAATGTTGAVVFQPTPGEIKGTTKGNTSVSASLVTPEGPTIIGTRAVVVGDARLLSIEITPDPANIPLQDTKQLTAEGTYTDGTTLDITNAVNWLSTPGTGNVAFQATKGLLKGISRGTATVYATFVPSEGPSVTGIGGAIVGDPRLVSIAIIPDPANVPLQDTKQLKAEGTYTDGSKQDLTSQATWSSTPGTGDVAFQPTKGLMKGISRGTATVYAAIVTPAGATVTGTGAAIVGDPRLVSIAITPDPTEVPLGATLQLTATGTYTDGTQSDITAQVNWLAATGTTGTVVFQPTNGLIKGTTEGATSVSASLNTVSGSQPVTVQPPALVSIAVTPSPVDVPLGTLKMLVATGTYTDNSTKVITNDVTWAPVGGTTGTVVFDPDTPGRLLAIQEGPTSVTATLSTSFPPPTHDVVGVGVINVTPAILTAITITPDPDTAPAVIPLGDTLGFIATGTYSDNTTRVITSEVTWTPAPIPGEVGVIEFRDSLAPNVATGVTKGLTRASASETNAVGTLITGYLNVTVADPRLVTIEISPAPTPPPAAIPDLPLGDNVQLMATGTYTDGSVSIITSQVLWSAEPDPSNPGDAEFDSMVPGRLIGTAKGDVFVFATSSNVIGGNSVTVVDARLVSLTITPDPANVAQGTFQQLQAMGTYTDSSQLDLTSEVTWIASTAGPGLVEFQSTKGQIKGIDQGATSVRAEVNTPYGLVYDDDDANVGPPRLTAITILPASIPNVPLGDSQQLIAIGTYSAGADQDITTQVAWQSTPNPDGAVTFNPQIRGLLTGSVVGTASLSATLANDLGTPVVGYNSVTVLPARLVTIEVTPATVTLGLNATQQLMVTGIYSDNSIRNLAAEVTWTSSPIASVDTTGLLTGNNFGNVLLYASVTASTGTVTSNAVDVTVNSAVLQSLTMDPTSVSVALGATTPVKVWGNYSDGSTLDVTGQVSWSPSSYATVDMAGLVKGTAVTPTPPPATTLTASLGSVSATLGLTVRAAELVSIAITPNPIPDIPLGATSQLTATGTYTNGTTSNLTTSVTWTAVPAPTNPGNATFSSTTRGLLQGTTQGNVRVTAALNSITSPTLGVVITAKALKSIRVTPVTSSVNSGATTAAYVATGTYTDDTTANISSTVFWSSNATGTATISNATATRGIATGGNTIGVAGIIATQGTIASPAATLNVLATVTVNVVKTASEDKGGTIITNNAQSITMTNAATTYKFSQGIAKGGTYNVGITNSSLPDYLFCSAVDGSGTVDTSNITVTVNCIVNVIYISNNGTLEVYAQPVRTSGSIYTETGYTKRADDPTALAVNASGTYLYVTPGNSSTRVVGSCPITVSNGRLSDTCLTGLKTSGSIPTTNPYGITPFVADDGTEYVLISSADGNIVYRCTASSNGTFNSCTSAGQASFFSFPQYIAPHPTQPWVYITNRTSGRLTFCKVNTSGASAGLFSSCVYVGQIFTTPRGVVVSRSGNYVYVAALNGSGNGAIYKCTLITSGANAGQVSGTCTATGTTGVQYTGLTINRAGTRLYVGNNNPNAGGGVRWYTIDQTDGDLSNTVTGSTGFNVPIGMTFY